MICSRDGCCKQRESDRAKTPQRTTLRDHISSCFPAKAEGSLKINARSYGRNGKKYFAYPTTPGNSTVFFTGSCDMYRKNSFVRLSGKLGRLNCGKFDIPRDGSHILTDICIQCVNRFCIFGTCALRIIRRPRYDRIDIVAAISRYREGIVLKRRAIAISKRDCEQTFYSRFSKRLVICSSISNRIGMSFLCKCNAISSGNGHRSVNITVVLNRRNFFKLSGIGGRICTYRIVTGHAGR